MSLIKTKEDAVVFYSALYLIFIFIIDSLIPLGFSIGLFYLLGFHIVIHKGRLRLIYCYMIAASILILLNFLIFFDDYLVNARVYFNRGISVFSVVVAGGITIYYRKLEKRLAKEREEYIRSLENMLFITSHRVRKPVSSCLGLMNLMDFNNPSKEELEIILKHLRTSANDLDQFTRDLTEYMCKIKEDHEKAENEMK
jgi:signal transduction histidine kinase